jgi:WD40 repeat protein
MSTGQMPRSQLARRWSALVLVGLSVALVAGLCDRAAWAADEVRRLEGHADQLTSMALSPDGKLLVTGSDDKTVRLWQFESGKELRALRGSATFVLSVAISADGRRVLSGSGGEFRNRRFSPGSDRSVRLWDVETGKELLKLEGHRQPVWCVKFLPDGRSAISISEGEARLWDLTRGREMRRFGGHCSGQGVALSPDGKLLVTGSYPENSARLWEVETGRLIRELVGNRAQIRGADFSPDGKLLLTGGGDFVRGGGDTTLRIWDVTTGKELRLMSGDTQLVWCVAFSPDGRKALSGGVEGIVRLWDVNSGKELHQFQGHRVVSRGSIGARADVRAVLFTPDGTHAVSAGHDRTIRVWKLPK